MLFAIGAGPQVVAVSSFDQYPPEVENLQRVGALLDPDLERILSLRPDLVVVYGSQTDLLAQLGRAQHPGLHLPPRRAGRRHGNDARDSASASGTRPRREQLATEIEARIGRSAHASAGAARPRTLIVFGRERSRCAASTRAAASASSTTWWRRPAATTCSRT